MDEFKTPQYIISRPMSRKSHQQTIHEERMSSIVLQYIETEVNSVSGFRQLKNN